MLAPVSYLRSLVVRAVHRHRTGVGSIPKRILIVDNGQLALVLNTRDFEIAKCDFIDCVYPKLLTDLVNWLPVLSNLQEIRNWKLLEISKSRMLRTSTSYHCQRLNLMQHFDTDDNITHIKRQQKFYSLPKRHKQIRRFEQRRPFVGSVCIA